ncbi:MAG TPA: copper resistance CopC family protein [Actinomycetes bacterium]|nr:copper resistance CopC family protein [Actinomycetes bacterium]
MPWLPGLAVGTAVVLAVGVAVMLADGPPEGDHAAVTSTSPADGATLATAPTEVGLTFTRPVDPNRSHIFVMDEPGTASVHTTGALRQTAPGRLSQPISMAEAGAVSVAYHVTFVDGAVSTGSLRFTVGSGTGAGQPAPASAHNHDIDPVSAALLLADGIAVLAVLVLLLRRPRRIAPSRR